MKREYNGLLSSMKRSEAKILFIQSFAFVQTNAYARNSRGDHKRVKMTNLMSSRDISSSQPIEMMLMKK